MKEAAESLPRDPATSDMVSGRMLQHGRPVGPLSLQAVGVDWRRIPPAHPMTGGLPVTAYRLAAGLPNELNRPHC